MDSYAAKKRLSQILAVVIGALAVIGLFTQGHLFGFMNVDLTLDVLRIPIAAALLYAGFGSASERTVDSVLLTVGILYLGMGALALADNKLFGLLPSGLTGFDIVFHLAGGALATWAGLRHTGDVHKHA
jgi:hypothetical protein